MRLFLTSAQVRGARITTLKITHLPYVAAILIYESLRNTLAGPDRPRAMDKRPSSSARVKRHSGLRHSFGRAGLITAPHNKSELSLVKTPVKERHGQSSVAADSALDELRWAVSKLSDQVERLTQRLEKGSVDSTAAECSFD